MSMSRLNIMLCFIISFIQADAESDFMDENPSCQDYIQAPVGPLKTYEDMYAELYKREEGGHKRLMDQSILSEMRFFPRCGNLGSPGEAYFPVEGVVEQNDRMWPWLLYFTTDPNCFGVYISPGWILTTASCIKSNLVTIRYPSYSSTGKIVHNSNFRLQEDYEREKNGFDIALIGVNDYEYTHPVCLPIQGVPIKFEDDKCFFIGYQPQSYKHIFQIKVRWERSELCDNVLTSLSVATLVNTCMKSDSTSSFPLFSRKHGGLPVNCYFGFAWHVVALSIPKQSLEYTNILVVSDVRYFDPWIRKEASH